MDESREAVTPLQMRAHDVFHYSIPALSGHGDGKLESGDDIESAKTRIRGGELLVARLNPRKGHVLIAKAPADLTVCSGEFVVLRPRECDSQFMYYKLSSELARQMLEGATQSVTKSHQRVRPEVITKMWVTLPTREEQRAIADFLDGETARIDSLIEKTDRMSELLRVRWTADVSEFFDQTPSHRFKQVLAIPLQYGLSEPAEHENPEWPRYVRTTDVTPEGDLREDTFKSIEPSIARACLLRDGDVLFTRSGATVGKSFVYQQAWGPACFAGYLIRARVDRTQVLPEFIRCFTESHSYWQQVSLNSLQATIQNVSAERYGNLRLPIPSLIEQKRLVLHLNLKRDEFRTGVSLLARRKRLLGERRQALITAAVTGQLDASKVA